MTTAVPFYIAIVVGGLALVCAATAALAVGISELMDWFDQCRLTRIARAEAELDRTQEQLRRTMFQLAEHLGQEAHETRKTLIRESFIASGQLPPRD